MTSAGVKFSFRGRKRQAAQAVARNGEPVARRVHVLFGQIHIAVAQVFGGVEFDLLVPHDFAHDLDFAVLHDDRAFAPVVEGIDHTHVGVGHGVRVVVRVHFADVRLLALEVQLVHVVLLGGQKINRAVMHGGKRAVPVHFGDDLVVSRVGGVDHHDVFGIDRPQAHFVGRIAFRRPVPAVVRPVEHALFLEVLQKLFEIFAAESFAFFKRQLEGRAFDVVQQNEQIVGIDPAMLGRKRKEVVGIFHDELIERIAARDQNRQRLPRPP